jgi:hypothetical protein
VRECAGGAGVQRGDGGRYLFGVWSLGMGLNRAKGGVVVVKGGAAPTRSDLNWEENATRWSTYGASHGMGWGQCAGVRVCGCAGVLGGKEDKHNRRQSAQLRGGEGVCGGDIRYSMRKHM